MRISTMRSCFIHVFGVFFVIFTVCGFVQAEHPFLIVSESDYPGLRALSSEWPWSDMKEDAISDIMNLSYNPNESDYKQKAYRMADIVEAGALACILEPDANIRSTYVNMTYDKMATWWPDLRAGITMSGADRIVPPGSAFFASVLALDILYNELTEAQRNTLENELQQVADWYNSRITPWQLNLYGCRGIWALYKGNQSDLNQAKNDYRNYLMSQLTPDGVFHQGPGYAGARLGFDRFAKAYFMDVLEFTGEDNNYYNNPTLKNFAEWLYGYAASPTWGYYTFGDSSLNRNYSYYSRGSFRANRFSEIAGRYAAFRNNWYTPPGRLLYYLFMTKPRPVAQHCPSRIFYDGGAWFLEDSDSSNALAGVLWNPRNYSSHSHKEINSINLIAYGEHVLRNSGYAGWGNPEGQWSYIHDDAESCNTAVVGSVDHVAKWGGGISEGFTSSGFDYASGDSLFALPNGHHQRNLVFVHPDAGVNGYWILFDELDNYGTRQWLGTYFHPNAENMTRISKGKEYESLVTFNGNKVYLTIFLGTEPEEVATRTGTLAHMVNRWISGKYLFSEYPPDRYGYRNIVTVLFPHNNSHTKANMNRISGSKYTGASISQGGSVEDVALESDGKRLITHNGVTFQGLASWYRLDSGVVSSYFVRKGCVFDDGLAPRVGFESSEDVSIHVEDTVGRIVSPSVTTVTFYCPDVTGVFLNGSPLSNTNSGTDWVQVHIPSGTYELELVTGLPPDTTPPAITLNGSATQFAECSIDSYTEEGATATDDRDSEVPVVIGGDTVDTSSCGTYVVTYNASDTAGNAAEQVERMVIVEDTTPPVISLSGSDTIILECAMDSYTEEGATAADICDDDVSVVIGGDTVDTSSCGIYEVTYDATDASGNAAEQVVRTVIVEDTLAPEFSLSVSPKRLWPPNHRMVKINVSKTASDNCDDFPEISLVSVVSNESDDGSGDGHTSDDIEIDEDGSIYLRAERSGNGEGRIYTITYEATDASGNSTVKSETVEVKRNRRWAWRLKHRFNIKR
ncbi:MAG: DUF5011 domain-containing protein [Planctomycetes bacterium]|nr:DUF5011 domain-containing protein [Planctomycetota bacterium]